MGKAASIISPNKEPVRIPTRTDETPPKRSKIKKLAKHLYADKYFKIAKKED